MAIKFSDKRNNQYVRQLKTLTPGDTFQKGEFFYICMKPSPNTLGGIQVFSLNTCKCEYFPDDTSVETVEIEMIVRQSRRERNKQAEDTEDTEDTEETAE